MEEKKMMSKIKFENLKQLEKELQARLDLEYAEKERLMNLIHFYESVYHHLSTQVEFANLDKQRLIDAQKYAEKNTKSDIRSLYAIQSTLSYPEFIGLSEHVDKKTH